MKKKNIFFILFLFFTLFISVKNVNAELTFVNQGYMIKKLAAVTPGITAVNVNGDIATVTSRGTVLGYYVGTTNSINASSTYYQGVTKNTFYAGVKNGTYYFWVTSGTTGRAVMYSSAVKVTSSCTSQKVVNATGSGTVERCAYLDSSNNVKLEAGELVTCANGYTLVQSDIKVVQNNCNGITRNYGGQELKYRYCKVVYSYNCVKKTTSTPGGSSGGNSGGGSSSTPAVAPTIASLSISGVSLKPGFSSGTKNYTANVGGGTSSVKINASAGSGSSFVNGYGPRTVNLNYGNNAIAVKVKNSAGKVAVYTININRADNRSNVNTLSNITVNYGTLSPTFSESTNAYNVAVDYNVESLEVGATLKDLKSSFIEGFGPRAVKLNPGSNSVMLKIKSESGKTNVYTLNVMRAVEDPICTTNADEMALLKNVSLVSDIDGVKFEDIEFESSKLNYPDIKIPYEVANLTFNVSTVDEGDTYTVSDAENLEVNVEKTVTITVKSKKCPSVSKTYTFIVTRQEEYTSSTESELKTLTIDGHSEIEFEPNVETYNITLNKGEKSLKINVTKKDDKATCTEEGNEDLAYGKEVVLRCVAEDGEHETVYTFKITGEKKGANVFLIIIVVILIIAILVYLVLRLLGYKVFINFAVIGAFFRGIGEKIKNIFDK